MQNTYTISPDTLPERNRFATAIYTGMEDDKELILKSYGATESSSRLRAVKLAMLLAINESEKG
jgi:hypothetical protein